MLKKLCAIEKSWKLKDWSKSALAVLARCVFYLLVAVVYVQFSQRTCICKTGAYLKSVLSRFFGEFVS